MNFKTIKTNFHRNIKLLELNAKHYSPEILLFLGIGSGVAAGVIACLKTREANDILVEAKEKIDNIHKRKEEPLGPEDVYCEEDEKRELINVYSSTAFKLAKTYAVPVGLGVFSIASILTSHGLVRKEAMCYAAAFSASNMEFKRYRKGVAEKYGEKADREIFYGINKEKRTVKKVDENGNEHEEEMEVNISDRMCGNYSSYARPFDETNDYWLPDSTYNLDFLRRAEVTLNSKLMRDGYVYLNDAYELLGFPKTLAGQVIGWVYDKSDDPIGDNAICFNIYDMNDESKREFLQGREKAIWVDFNVDGNIWELMMRKGTESPCTGNPFQDQLDKIMG